MINNEGRRREGGRGRRNRGEKVGKGLIMRWEGNRKMGEERQGKERKKCELPPQDQGEAGS